MRIKNLFAKLFAVVVAASMLCSVIPEGFAGIPVYAQEEENAAEEFDDSVDEEIVPEESSDEEISEEESLDEEIPTDESVEESSEDIIEEEETSLLGKDSIWTVFIYMCGADLETEGSCGSDNLQALLGADYNEDVRYVVQTGGSEEWNNEWVDADKTQRFVIQGSDIQLVEEYEMQPMNETTTLANFISWGHDNFPSDKSMFVMWDHGAGVIGAISDENYASTIMTTEDIVRAFSKADVHFDVIGFDACLMADFDVAYAMSSFSDYYVASEEIIPGCGWDYAGLASFLAQNPECTPEGLCRNTCDNYEDNLIAQNIGGTSTLSVVKTSELQGVKEAVTGMVDAMIGVMEDPEQFADMLFALNTSKRYTYPFEKDLTSLARDAQDYIGRESVLQVEDAVRKAVIYRTQHNEAYYNNGLSFFWGLVAPEQLLDGYAAITSLDNYLAFLDAYIYSWHAPMDVYDRTSHLDDVDVDYFRVSADSSVKKNVPTLHIAKGNHVVKEISYSLFTEADNGRMIQIGQFENLKALKNNNYAPMFDGMTATIDGNPLVLNVVSETPEHVIYYSPVLLKEDDEYTPFSLKIAYYPGEKAVLRDAEGSHWNGSFASNPDGRFEIVGLVDEYSHSAMDVLSRDILALENGMEIYIAYPQIADVDSEERFIKGPSFVYDSKETSVELDKLFDGEYILSFSITDVRDVEETFGEYTMSLSGNKLSLAQQPTAPVASTKEELVHLPYASRLDADVSDSIGEDVTLPEEETEEINAQTNDKVTVFLYLDGSFEKEAGFGTRYLESMLDIPESDDVNILIETGGCDSWKNDVVKGNYAQRFELSNQLLTEVYRKPKCNFADPFEFADFLTWGVSNYPADKYVLIMYDHGGAWRGNTRDDEYDSCMMSLPDITYALQKSGVHFEDIIYNCCLMSSVEVAAAMAPYADYMIGSEESILAVDYQECELLRYIIEHADNLDGEQYGKFVCDSLMNDLENEGAFDERYFQEMSLIDLSKVDRLVEAINNYGLEMSTRIDDPEAICNMISGMNSSRDYGYTYMRDVVDLVQNTPGILAATANEVYNAVQEAVVYMRANADNRRNCGITMCYPSIMPARMIRDYSDVCPYKDYLAFMDAITYDWNVRDSFYDETTKVTTANPCDYRLSYKIVPVEDDRCALAFDEDYDHLISAYYQVFKYDEEQGILIGLDYNGNLTIDEENGWLIENFDGRIVTLDDAQCYIQVYEETKDRTVYSIPVIYDGSKCYLRVAYYPTEQEKDSIGSEWMGGNYTFKGEFSIIGLVGANVINTGIVELDACKIEDEMSITMLIPEYDKDGNLTYWNEGETIVCTSDSRLALKNVDDGEYILRFVLSNGLGITEMSDMIPITVLNGRINSVEIPEYEEEDESDEAKHTEEAPVEEKVEEDESAEEETEEEELAEELEDTSDDVEITDEESDNIEEADVEDTSADIVIDDPEVIEELIEALDSMDTQEDIVSKNAKPKEAVIDLGPDLRIRIIVNR